MQIRAYRDEDLAELRQLMAAVYGDAAISDEIWRWRHFGLGGKNGAMVAVDGGAIVGQQPMELYDFHFGGRPVPGAVLTGVMVHPRYRRRGLFGNLVGACEQTAWDNGAAFVTTMPNEQSFPAFMKSGYVDPGLRTLLVRVVDPEPLAVRLRAPPRVAALGGAVGRLGLAGLASMLRRSRRIRVEHVTGFSEDVDQLFTQFVAGSAGLCQVRSLEWLRWRYERAPLQPPRLFEARENGRLVGWAVSTTEQREGLRVGYLVDILAIDGAARRALILAVSDDLANAGVAIILSVVSNRELIRALVSCLFVPVPRRTAPKKFYTVFKAAPGRRHDLAALASIGNWYQTLGDWDNI